MSNNIFSQLFAPVSPLMKPKIVPNLGNLAAIQRIINTLTYSLSQFEYWIAPTGWLRQWIRINIAILVLGAIPAIVVVPIITYLVMKGIPIMQILIHISHNVLYCIFLLIIIGSVLDCAYTLLKYRTHPLVKIVILILGGTTIVILSYHWFNEYIKYVFYSVKSFLK